MPFKVLLGGIETSKNKWLKMEFFILDFESHSNNYETSFIHTFQILWILNNAKRGGKHKLIIMKLPLFIHFKDHTL